MNKYDINDRTSYCLGMSLTIEALKNQANYVSEVILSNKANRNEQLDLLLKLCNDNSIKVSYDDKTIDKLSLKENCYCIGFFNKYVSDLQSNKHLLIYRFNNYGDLGTILRSAICFDFKDIVLIDSDIDYFDPRCIRASMGSIFHCNIIKYNSLDDYLDAYPNQTILPFLSKSNNELSTLNVTDNYSIVISQDYYGLDSIFNDGYYIDHKNLDEISLSIRSSIILEYLYHLNLKR